MMEASQVHTFESAVFVFVNRLHTSLQSLLQKQRSPSFTQLDMGATQAHASQVTTEE